MTRIAILLALLIPAQQAAPDVDVMIVGAGISGLSAALEAARGGAHVLVIDMASVFGGHAVMSEGGVAIVATPLQQANNIADSPTLAFKDFTDWGKDVNQNWVRYYVQHSRRKIYDWLTEMGIQFTRVLPRGGNSVPRFHYPLGRGLGLVSPLYRECVKHPGVNFVWNTQITSLIVERGRIVGMQSKDLRTGETRSLRAQAVILATGGFQSNLDMLREYWPKDLSFPDRILVGSGVNSVGSGHEMAKQVGGVYFNMDHQWNYPSGLPDPRYPGGKRGLDAGNPQGIWVTTQGRRFINERLSSKFTFEALLRQKPATYWLIFDEATKHSFRVSGADWGDFSTIQHVLFDNPNVIKTAATLEELAASAELPVTTLVETVRRYNAFVAKNDDADFHRFGPHRPPNKFFSSGADSVLVAPQKIEQPPFYAAQFFPLTRKSMGGVQVDLSCRVLDAQKRPIPGLYAVGELTGLVGINGKAGLEGTFLGPSIITGRVAGRAIVAALKTSKKPASTAPSQQATPSVIGNVASQSSCRQCHDVEVAVEKSRNGYWHFERAHRVVLERNYDCLQCHAEMAPYQRESHRINRLAQINTCSFCHVAQ